MIKGQPKPYQRKKIGPYVSEHSKWQIQIAVPPATIKECNTPRYMKHPALMAPRTLLAVSEEVATAAPTITPMKLVHATAVE